MDDSIGRASLLATSRRLALTYCGRLLLTRIFG